MLNVTFVVSREKTKGLLKDLFYHEGNSYAKGAINLEVFTIDELNFFPENLADCYIFESNVAASPWIMSLGRYLPGPCDWTTTTEIIEKAGRNQHSSGDKFVIAMRFLMEGTVVPFALFEMTWLSMRRHYTCLFSEDARKAVGCSHQEYRRVLSLLRTAFEWQGTPPHNHVTVTDFLAAISKWNQWNTPGFGPKRLLVIHKTLDLYGLKV
jgi:hypothetical protein